MCNAMKQAEKSVRPSPQRKAKDRSCPREMKPTPPMQSSAATMLKMVGRLRSMAQYRNGTMTQYVPVRNALRPGVVSVRPTFCTQKAKNATMPSTHPYRMCSRLKWRRMVFRQTNPTIIAVSRKRMLVSHPGVMSSKAPLTTTKEKPQNSVARTRSVL